MALDATICILTYNGEDFLESLLDSVYSQKSKYSFEVLVIDSGSKDLTLDICKNYKDLRLHQIDNTDFGHGKTRNLAISLSNSEFVVFLTQDAVPASDRWLESMIEPFKLIPEISCVFGKQIARPDCVVNVKREVTLVFRSFGDDGSISLQRKNELVARLGIANNFLSDVNSAVRKENAVEVPFRDIDYAEDQALGRDHLDAGWIKAYAPLGSVYHSHNYPPKKYFFRKFDEVVGLYTATGFLQTVSRKHILKAIIIDTIGCWKFAVRDREYSFKMKIKNILKAPIYNVLLQRAIFAARNPEKHQENLKKFSLELSQKKKNK